MITRIKERKSGAYLGDAKTAGIACPSRGPRGTIGESACRARPVESGSSARAERNSASFARIDNHAASGPAYTTSVSRGLEIGEQY